jgi:hypothetical protein
MVTTLVPVLYKISPLNKLMGIKNNGKAITNEVIMKIGSGLANRFNMNDFFSKLTLFLAIEK